MLQVLATLLFLMIGMIATGLIAVLVRADWETIRIVTGQGATRLAPLPPRVRRLAARRATIIQLSPRALSRAA